MSGVWFLAIVIVAAVTASFVPAQTAVATGGRRGDRVPATLDDGSPAFQLAVRREKDQHFVAYYIVNSTASARTAKDLGALAALGYSNIGAMEHELAIARAFDESN